MRKDDRVSALRRLLRRVRALLRRWRRDAAQRLREVTGRDDVDARRGSAGQLDSPS
jgi:hypothetical protein